MTIFYTVDRKNLLKSELLIDLLNPKDIDIPMLLPHFQKMFPRGVSSFGAQFLLKSHKELSDSSSIIEMVFEYERRLNHRERPSRLQSFYAAQTLEEAREFRETWGKKENRIWKVECDNYFIGDFNLLNTGPNNLALTFLAKTYWSGQTVNELPFWEALLIPPVRVINCVE